MENVPTTRHHASKALAHGGELGAVRARYPDAPQPWLDLSTGLNPVGYPLPPLAAESWQRLPSRAAEQALLAAAARRYGVADPNRIVAAPGTQSVIQLLPRLVSRSTVAVVGPTYAEHAACWRRAGHDVRIVRDLDEASSSGVVVLVNPDNPTGRLLPAPLLRGLRCCLLVVDEAFADLLPGEASLAADLPERTVVLRSFGKTYGLGGLRLGFAIASAELAGLLRDELGPWAVPGPALEIGRLALDDDGWLEAARARLRRDGARLDALLRAAGATPEGATPLFRLVRHAQPRRLADQLAAAGIHVRSFAEQPGWLRFGIPAGDDAFARLADALQVPQNVR